MRRVQVVIGAGYGDEGKGRVTDLLCGRSVTRSLIVCRFNGGAQAGHNVVIEGVGSHVHSHVGSGALSRVATYLGPKFVLFPELLDLELAELDVLWEDSGHDLYRVATHPLALVSTPCDRLINVLLEKKRGDGRHGSCGMGFGEAIGRSEAGYPIPAYALVYGSNDHLFRRLNNLRDEWLPRRLAQEGLELTALDHEWLANAEDVWLNAVRSLRRCDSLDDQFANEGLNHEHVIFEGAQGLELDMKHGYFPHVTRSRCGVEYVNTLLRPSDEVELVYVTRSYKTRHGAGLLPLEVSLKDLGLRNTENETNTTGAWQASFATACSTRAA